MNFQIKNRFSGEVQFECELSADVENASYGFKLGFSVKKAFELGADLRDAVLRDADLRDADLSDADLSDADLRGADLRDADLSDADLRGADLRGAVLRDADLRGADLRGADLRGADLSGADWIPKIPNIHSTVYAAASCKDALKMDSWHCGTSHCRAGWIVTLAGDAGKVMEGVYGTAAAAALIYQASDPTLEKVPDFYCGNKAALSDMKRLADAEKSA